MANESLSIVWTVEEIEHRGLSLAEALASRFESNGNIVSIHESEDSARHALYRRREKVPSAVAAGVYCRAMTADGEIVARKEV